MEIKELDMKLSDDGAYYSGGRSFNVWGRVPIESLPFDRIAKFIIKGRKSPIHTCYDEDIYVKNENGEILPINQDNFPQTISATFKSCRDRYSAVSEHIAMRFAELLDIPTSFNYLVSFDEAKHPGIANHLKINKTGNKPYLPYGIVSIDFLKSYKAPTREEESPKSGLPLHITEIGERLISFDECIAMSGTTGNDFHIETWIKSIDKIAKNLLPNTDEQTLNKKIKKIKSRIVRSFLFREVCGDVDFTDLNGGLVYCPEKEILEYAPNHDFGECFIPLIKTKLDYLPHESELREILKWQPNYIEQKEAKRKGTLIETLAQEYASDSSEANLAYVVQNFPEDMKEFSDNLVTAIMNNSFAKVIDECTMSPTDDPKTCPLLDAKASEFYKIYINTRAGWLQSRMRQMQIYNTFAK